MKSDVSKPNGEYNVENNKVFINLVAYKVKGDRSFSPDTVVIPHKWCLMSKPELWRIWTFSTHPNFSVGDVYV